MSAKPYRPIAASLSLDDPLARAGARARSLAAVAVRKRSRALSAAEPDIPRGRLPHLQRPASLARPCRIPGATGAPAGPQDRPATFRAHSYATPSAVGRTAAVKRPCLLRQAPRALFCVTAILFLFAAAGFAADDVPVVTTIADFEDDSVATTIASVENVLRTACALKRSTVPARGQSCLQLEIGVTGGEASAVVDFRLRDPGRYDQADRIAAFYWLNGGSFDLAFDYAMRTIRSSKRRPKPCPPRIAGPTSRSPAILISSSVFRGPAS